MKKNLLKIYEGFFDNITDDLDKLNPNQDDGFGDVNSGIYDEHDFILSPYKNPEFFEGLCNMCKDYQISYNENGFTQEDLDKITYLDTFFYVSFYLSYFKNLTSLNELQYFYNLREIRMLCFSECKKLKSVIFPKNLKIIRSYSFDRCISLNEISFPEDIQEIECFSFTDCKNIKKIIIPKRFNHKIKSIFDNVDLSKVDITYI